MVFYVALAATAIYEVNPVHSVVAARCVGRNDERKRS